MGCSVVKMEGEEGGKATVPKNLRHHVTRPRLLPILEDPFVIARVRRYTAADLAKTWYERWRSSLIDTSTSDLFQPLKIAASCLADKHRLLTRLRRQWCWVVRQSPARSSIWRDFEIEHDVVASSRSSVSWETARRIAPCNHA